MKKEDFENTYKVCPVCSAPIQKGSWYGSYQCSLKPTHFGYHVSGYEITDYAIYFDKFISMSYRLGKITITKKSMTGPNQKLVMACEDPSIWLKDPNSLFERFEKLLLLSG